MKHKVLYRVGRQDVKQAASVLGRAFRDYPIFRHLFPDARTRPDSLEHVMRFFLGCGLLRGEVLAPTSELEGIAIWYRSDEQRFGWLDVVRAGALSAFVGLGPASFRRFQRLGKAKQVNRDETMKGDYWLLDVIGVDPAEVGRGYARRLIEPKLEQADQERTLCYLETSDSRNIGLYEKFGFRVAKTYRFEGVESFCLQRTPPR